MSGIPTMSPRTGLLTAMAMELRRALGLDLGLTTLHGVSLPTTMADGTILVEGGAGAPARSLVPRSMGLPLWVS